MQSWQKDLERWQTAGIVSAETADSIRAFEAAEARPAGQRWQVLIALILGSILLGAGVLLFVAAHWDEVSPLQRLALVIGCFALLHISALFATDRFPALATALHAIGTVGSGAAIAMVGQIFNMQEHWPAAVMLWALCAGAGWWLLRDQFQQVCFLLLAPAWLICEWSYRADPYANSWVYLARMMAVLGAVYLTAFMRSSRRAVWGILFAVSGIALIAAAGVLADGWNNWRTLPPLPASLRIAAFIVMAAMLGVGSFWDRRSVIPAALVLIVSLALPWLQTRVHEQYAKGGYDRYQPSVLAYALVAGVAVFFAWWGVREASRALVNYGILAFAVTICWFYFSSLMDKLGRSLGLIGLGVLFLAGGWLLERMRRRLIAGMQREVAA